MRKIIILAGLVSFHSMAAEKCLSPNNKLLSEGLGSLLNQSEDITHEIELKNDGIADETVIELNNGIAQNEQRSCLERYNQHLMLGKKRSRLLRIYLVSGLAILASAPLLSGAGVAFSSVGAGAAISGGGGAISMTVGAGFAFGGIATAGAIGSLWEPKTLSGLEKGILAVQWASSDQSRFAPKFLRRMISREQDIILKNIKNDIQLKNPNESRKVLEAMFMNKVAEQTQEISNESIKKVKEFIKGKLSNGELCPADKLPYNLQKIEKLHKRQLSKI